MWQRESRRSGEGRKKQRLIQLLHESSAASPDSGLLSKALVKRVKRRMIVNDS